MKILSKKPHWFKIKTKDGSVPKLKLNKGQLEILNYIQKELEENGKVRLIIVKGRQLGMSTFIELLLLSYAMSQEAFTGYAMAHDTTTANDLFDKIIKFAWQNMDENLRNIYKVKRDNTRQLMIENMNSSSVTVGLSGRGGTIDFLHVSEAGKISENPKLWQEMISGTFPAAEHAKGIIIESTADGGLGPFYEMVQESLQGKSEFKTIFLCWTEADEYQRDLPKDDSWKADYKQLASKYKLYSDPVKQFGITDKQWYWYYKKVYTLKEEIKVQYPFTLEEAFISKALNKFDIAQLKAIKPLTPLRESGGVKFFGTPKEGHVYAMGIDGSSGLSADYSAFSVREMGTRRVIAQFKGKIGETAIADLAVNTANWINKVGKCYIAPEKNGLGIAIVNRILQTYPEHLIYKSYISDPTKQLDTMVPDYGWKTTSITRPDMVNRFASDFHEGLIPIVNEEQIQEMITFIYNDKNNRYEARDGKHDDLLFSDMICNQCFNYIIKYG